MNAKELLEDWEMPGKAVYHFPNPAARPSVLVLALRQRRWLFRASFALCTADSQRLNEQSGSEGHGEHHWMKCSVSSLWTGPFLDRISGDTARIQQCRRSKAPAKFLNSSRELNQQFEL